MSANPIDENTTPKTTGSLEELFRHHMGEGAAVPPRPMLWDQIDNSLLIRQNEIYRRRLTATRWVAAASLLLATLAGTGWWAKNDASLSGTAVAVRTQPVGAGAGSSAGRRAGVSAANSRQARDSGSGSASQGNAATSASAIPVPAGAIAAATGTSNGSANARRAGAASAYPAPAAGFKAAAARQDLARNDAAAASTARKAGSGVGHGYSNGRYATAAGMAVATGGTAATGAMARTTQPTTAEAAFTKVGNSPGATTTGQTLAASNATTSTATPTAALTGATASTPAAAAAQAAAAASPRTTALEQMEWLAARNAALALADPAGLPKGLTALALPADAAPATADDLHKWHYGTSYTAGVFNPNVNFSRAGIESEFDYNPALGDNSPALTEAAAAQYRENLRPGFSQRLALLATRHLGGHWSLTTGAEFTQATAKSASSSAFVGEQIPDLGQASKGPLLTTDFRYRMASIPVEVRYANPVKRGWSLYGRLGGVVSALLGVRSEVEGDPEATKTYSFTSAGMPYRRILGSIRGGAGVQFRPTTGNWAFTLGPVAELGLVPLNAHPAQTFTAQSRPYSFGVEAGVEFGR